MKRSTINRLEREALALFTEHRFSLPLFARWTTADWQAVWFCAGLALLALILLPARDAPG